MFYFIGIIITAIILSIISGFILANKDELYECPFMFNICKAIIDMPSKILIYPIIIVSIAWLPFIFVIIIVFLIVGFGYLCYSVIRLSKIFFRKNKKDHNKYRNS